MQFLHVVKSRSVPSGQVGFFTIIVQPTFTLMAELQHRVKVHRIVPFDHLAYLAVPPFADLTHHVPGCAADSSSDQY